MSRKSLSALPLNRLTRRHRQALLHLDLLWPDSRPMMSRIAERLRATSAGTDTEAAIVRMLQAAAEAYYSAAPGDDYERFGACVDALAATLDRQQARFVAQSLSHRQRQYLARRLPPAKDQRT